MQLKKKVLKIQASTKWTHSWWFLGILRIRTCWFSTRSIATFIIDRFWLLHFL